MAKPESHILVGLDLTEGTQDTIPLDIHGNHLLEAIHGEQGNIQQEQRLQPQDISKTVMKTHLIQLEILNEF